MATIYIPKSFIPHASTGLSGSTFILPGHDNWTEYDDEPVNGVLDNTRSAKPRDMTDAMHYFLTHYNPASGACATPVTTCPASAFRASPAAGGGVPLNGTLGNPNTVVFQPDTIYHFEFGFKVGATRTQASGGGSDNSPNAITSYSTLVNGFYPSVFTGGKWVRIATTWPHVNSPGWQFFYVVFDLNGSELVQTDNQVSNTPYMQMSGVVKRLNTIVTNVTIPATKYGKLNQPPAWSSIAVYAEDDNVTYLGETYECKQDTGSNHVSPETNEDFWKLIDTNKIPDSGVQGLKDQLIRATKPTWDWTVPNDGGGWVFRGRLVAGSNKITNVEHKYGPGGHGDAGDGGWDGNGKPWNRPLSRDWEWQLIDTRNVANQWIEGAEGGVYISEVHLVDNKKFDETENWIKVAYANEGGVGAPNQHVGGDANALVTTPTNAGSWAEFGLSATRMFNTKDANIDSITTTTGTLPQVAGRNYIVTLSEAPRYNWGVYPPYQDTLEAWQQLPFESLVPGSAYGTPGGVKYSWALLGHPLADPQPRKADGVRLVRFANGSNTVQIKNGGLRMGNVVGKRTVATPYEADGWHCVSFAGCANITLGDPTGATFLTVDNAWCDTFNFSSSYNTRLSYIQRPLTNVAGAERNGRHMFTIQGEQGLYVDHCTFEQDRFHDWYFDCESFFGARMVDHHFDYCHFGSNAQGLMHLKPSAESMPAPAYLNGCSGSPASPIMTVVNTSSVLAAPLVGGWPVNASLLGFEFQKPNVPQKPKAVDTAPVDASMIGGEVIGQGIRTGTYIKAVGAGTLELVCPPDPVTGLPQTPITETFNNRKLVRGDVAPLRGFHFKNCTSVLGLEIWFDGTGGSPGDLWFNGMVYPNQTGIHAVQFADRLDGRPKGTMLDVFNPNPQGPYKKPTIFSAYGDTYKNGARINVTGWDTSQPQWGFTTTDIGDPDSVGPFGRRMWFYVNKGAGGWLSDIEFDTCTGIQPWSGVHDQNTAASDPCMMLPHNCSDVRIVNNVQPGNQPLRNGVPQTVNQIVGTTNNRDNPMWPPTQPAGAVKYRFGPKDLAWTGADGLGPLIGPPLPAPGTNPRWRVVNNHFSGAIDNQVLENTTVGVWLGGLVPGTPAYLGSAGTTSPVQSPLYGLTSRFDAMPITASLIAVHPSTGQIVSVTGGTVTFYDGATVIGTVPVTSSTVTIIVPVGYFAINSFHNITARYAGAIVNGTTWASTSLSQAQWNASGGIGPPVLGAFHSTLTNGWLSFFLGVGTGGPTPSPVTVTFTALPQPLTYPDALTLTATISSNYPGGGHPPIGAVKFISDISAEIGSGVISAAGELVLTRVLNAGDHAIYAQFIPSLADQYNSGANSEVTIVTIDAPEAGNWSLGTIRF